MIGNYIDLQGIVILLLIFLPLERLLPHRAEQPILRRHWFNDSIYLVINAILIRFGFVALVGLVMGAARAVVPGGVAAGVAGLPLAVQAIGALVVADVGFYFAHRLLHAVPFLWRFHAVHHSIEELDWLAAHRVHPLDQIFVSACSLVPVFALGFSALAVTIMAFVYMLQSHLVHANVAIGFGPLRHVIASPLYHHWHHARGVERTANFAAHFTYMDRIFGTLRLPAEMPDRLGIDDPMPQSYLHQLAWPLLPARRAPQPEAAE